MRPFLLAATILATLAPCLAPGMASAAEPAPPIPAEAGPLPAGKLDGSVAPSAYRLDLTVDPAKERFSGHVEIDAAVKKASRTVWLHGRDLNVTRVTASAGGKVLTGTWQQADPTGVALLTFPEALPAGAVTFAFDYDAAFGDHPAGLYRIKVGDDWYAWTQFESIDARGAFPAFDEPGFKVPWTVTLRTPAGQKAVSNAPEVATETKDGMTIHRFAQTLPLPSYLVALVAGPFVTVEGTVPPTPERATPLPVRVVSTKQNAGQLDFALEGTKGIVQHLEGYFGQAFPYPKLDQITSPVMPGAMENAGADIFGDSILVMDDKAPVSQKRTFGMVVAHELAHQWFGDLVTPAWWDDIWLNESFANWMGYRIGNEWRPDLNIGAGAVAEGFGAMNTDALIAGRPIHAEIASNDRIDSAFDSITYGKGGHVVAMIAAFMGDTRFRDGVRRYMAAHKYGNATSKDFFGAMADAAGDPRILSAMQSFTDQQGVPLVTFAHGKKPGEWTATQSRYVRLGTPAPQQTWGIPLCARQGEERRCELMTDASLALTMHGKGPLMPNAGGTGYYRFELPAQDWDALIRAIPTLPAGEAIAVEDSMRASFYAGRLDVGRVLATTRALAAHPDSYASATATALLESADYRGVIAASAKAQFRRFIAGIKAPQLKALGFDPRAGAYAADDPERQQKRAELVRTLAGTAKDAALRAQLAKAADAFLSGDKAALDPAFLDIGLEAWLDGKGLTGARTLMEKALASEDPVFRPAAQAAVGASGKADIAAWVLDDLKDDRLRASERQGLFANVITTAETREQGYTWMKAHLDELTSGNGIFFASRLPGLLSGFCSVELAGEFEGLRPRFAGKNGALELERSIEFVRSCGRLKEARGAELTAAVAKLR